AVAGDVNRIRVVLAVRLPITKKFLALWFRLASRQGAQQGGGSGSGDEMSSIHWVRSYGGRLSVSPWLRLYAAQACPAVVSQQTRAIGFRLFHQAMPAISSAVG